MRTVRSIEHRVAYVTPALVLVFALVHAWRSDFSHKVVLAGVTMIVAASLLGVALHRRSNGKEAVFGTARFEAESDDDSEELVDVASPDCILLFCAGLFVVTTATLPLL
jgi:hypothetical protein